MFSKDSAIWVCIIQLIIKKLDLKRFRIVEHANQIGEEIWLEVSDWNHFNKETIGKQMVRAADSISANLSEAYGRYLFADRKRFCYNAYVKPSIALNL